MFGNLKDRLARAIFKRQPVKIKTPTITLMWKLQESGCSDTTADDWFYKKDVLEAVDQLKGSSFPITGERIDEIFGNLNLNYDDIR